MLIACPCCHKAITVDLTVKHAPSNDIWDTFRPALTPQQVRICKMIIAGETYEAIVEKLGYRSPGSLRNTLARIYDLFGCGNRAELTAMIYTRIVGKSDAS